MRIVRWLAALALMTMAAGGVEAQSVGNWPNVHQNVDANGVDVAGQTFSTSMTDVSIGPNDKHGLAYTRTWMKANWFDNFTIMLNGSLDRLILVMGPTSQTFTPTDSSHTTYTPDAADGSILVRNIDPSTYVVTYTYTGRDGTVITFWDSTDVPAYAFGPTIASTIAAVSTLRMPDGTVWTFNYTATNYTIAYSIPDATVARISSVTNNLGYQIKFTYALNSTYGHIDNYQLNSWATRTGVTAINNAVEYCDPYADTCSLSNSWPSASFGYTGGNLTSVTDPRGKTWQYGYTLAQPSSMRRPGASVDDWTVTYSGTQPTSVTKFGSTWYYSFSLNTYSNVLTTAVTDPLSHTRSVASDNNSNLVTTDTNENGWTASYAWDGSGRLTQISYPEGNYTTYSYDSRGNVTDTNDYPVGGGTALHSSAYYASTCNGWDGVDGISTWMTAQNCNEPLRMTDARSNSTYYGWNANGPIGWIKGPAVGGVSPETHYYYANAGAWYYGAAGGSGNGNSPDAVNLLIYTLSCRTGNWGCASSNQVRVDYGYYGGPSPTNMDLAYATTGAGDGSLAATAYYAYDNIGNVTQVTDPNGNAAKRVYNENRQMTMEITPDPDGGGSKRNRAQQVVYGDDGRPSYIFAGTSNGDGSSPSWSQAVTPLYDAYGRKWLETLSNFSNDFAQTQYSYDSVGRPQCTAVRMDPAAFSSPPSSACSQGYAGTDRIRYNVYEYAGGLDSVYDGYGVSSINSGAGRRTVHYVHNTNGQVTSLTDGNGNVTTYEYDGYRRMVKTRYPNVSGGGSSTSDYQYLTLDENGNVTDRQLRDGSTHIGYSYDALNRVTGKTRTGESSVSYSYDNQNNLTGATESTVTLSFSYDALGRVTTATQPFGTISYGYDAGGRRTSVTLPGSMTATYCYDATNAMTAVREGGSGCSGGTLLASYGYDDLGNRTSITRGNGVTTSLRYDPVSRLNQIVHDLTGTTDDVAINIGTNPSNASDATGYNAANQIVARSVTNPVYAWTQTYNVSRGYSADGLNRYNSVSSGSWAATYTPTYDARGNLTSAGGSTYQYRAENQLKSSTSDGISLYYDPLNRLAEYDTTISTRFVYDGGEIAAEVDGSGNILRRYITGAGADEPLVWYEGSGTSDKRWLVADERGSIIAVTNSAGQQLAINTYDDFGIPASTNLGRFQYTGQAWLPELGLYYYKARMYSATLGRFLQTDPIGYGDGPNWYNYVGGDPINNSDPDGLDQESSAASETTNGSAPNKNIVVTGAKNAPTSPPPLPGGLISLAAGALGLPDFAFNSIGSVLANSLTPKKIISGLKNTADAASSHTGEIVVVGARVGGHIVSAPVEVAAMIFDAFQDPLCCFTAGTLVSTPSGLKAIETLKVGDLVISRSDTTGQTAAKPIIKITPAHKRRIWAVTVSYKDKADHRKKEQYETTDDHPWRTIDGHWIASASLKHGQVLARERGTAVVEEVIDTGKVDLTYNLEIADFHTYFVGVSGTWVHNECAPTHNHPYAPRVFERGKQDPRSHNFPYSYDAYILRTQPKTGPDGYSIYQLPGHMGKTEGVFELGVNADGVIDHRFFRPY